jgi:guanylate kinase
MPTIAPPDSNRVAQKATGESPAYLIVLSAPSGAGKTTLCRELRQHFPQLGYSVSYTTRPQRGHEQGGVDYHFISKAEFKSRIARGAWAEWALVHDHFYGTGRDDLLALLKQGQSLLLDIDIQGTLQIVKSFPETITVFIMPPTDSVLEARLRQRGADTDATITKRLQNAEREMALRYLYRYIVVNDDLSQAVEQLVQIITPMCPR